MAQVSRVDRLDALVWAITALTDRIRADVPRVRRL
jgi:phage terminase large subunit-like protein